MATFGALNNANVNDVANLNGLAFMSGGAFSGGGTLTGIYWYMASNTGGGNWRCGVYSGGSSSDPNGASRLWDSGLLTNDYGATPGWQFVPITGAGALPSSGRVWVVAMSEVTQVARVVSGADIGGFDAFNCYFLDTVGGFSVNNASAALPATVGASPSGTSGTPLKAYLEYTVGGGGNAARSRYRQMMGCG